MTGIYSWICVCITSDIYLEIENITFAYIEGYAGDYPWNRVRNVDKVGKKGYGVSLSDFRTLLCPIVMYIYNFHL